MSAVANKKPSNLVRPSVPRETEARHLLFLGVTVSDVCEITGLRKSAVKKMQEYAAGFGEPYSPDTAAAVLGVCYRSVFRMVDDGRLKSKTNEDHRHCIPKSNLEKAADARLRHDGERRARYLLFTGKSVRLAAIRGRMTEAKATALLKELERAGAGPKHPGPFTVKQASIVLGLERSGRQVRGYCEQERLGTKFGCQYQIEREELERFGALNRKSGKLSGIEPTSAERLELLRRAI